MLYLIQIHWTPRVSDAEQPAEGQTVYAEYARSLAAATTKAVRKFNLHYGVHRAITATGEHQDPARIFLQN